MDNTQHIHNHSHATLHRNTTRHVKSPLTASLFGLVEPKNHMPRLLVFVFARNFIVVRPDRFLKEGTRLLGENITSTQDG